VQLLPYLTVLPLLTMERWRLLVQPGGQLVLAPDGTASQTDTSTLSLVDLAAVVTAVLVGPPFTLPLAHSIATYIQRLEARLAIVP